MNINDKKLALGVLVAIATSSAAHAQATSSAFSASHLQSGNPVPCGSRQDAVLSASASCSQVDLAGGTSSFATAVASAQPGVVRVAVNAYSISDFTLGNLANNNLGNGVGGFTNASANFRDAITIDSVGLSGQIGTLTGGFVVSGAAAAGVTGIAAGLIPNNNTSANTSYEGEFLLGGAVATFAGGVRDNFVSGRTSTLPPASYYALTWNFTFGQPFIIGAGLNLLSNATAYRIPTSQTSWVDSSATASADFGHTLYWGGITGLTDSQGQATSYTLRSASGVDYRSATVSAATGAVPEPSTWVMILVGFGAVGTTLRKTASRRRGGPKMAQLRPNR